MADPNEPLLQLALGSIARRCAEESELFFNRRPNDPRFCFELARRAIQERSQEAWQSIYTQYRALVSSWVARHPGFESTGESIDYFVNCTFEKLWSALSPEKFALFADLKAMLRYLQMCAHSVMVDHIRSHVQLAGGFDPQQPLGVDAAIAPDTIAGTMEQIQQRELWRWLETQLRDDKERRVVYGSFFLALRPRELHEEFRGTFRDVAEVHRVKENVLARLRRSPELRRFFGEDAGKSADSSFNE